METDTTFWMIAGGAAGLALGVLAALVLGQWRTGRGRVFGTALAAGLAVLGMRLGPALVGGPAIADSAASAETQGASPTAARFEGALEAAMEREWAGNPVFVAVERVAPDRSAAWREAVMTAYREHGLSAGRAANLRFSEAMGGWIASEYAPRATDEALLAFYSELQALAAGPLSARPRACYAFLYGDAGGALSASDMAALDDMARPYVHRVAGLVDGAAETPLLYDREQALAVQQAALEVAIVRIGEENLPLLDGRLPAGEAEYRLACEGMAAYLGAVLEAEDRMDALRSFAAGAG